MPFLQLVDLLSDYDQSNPERRLDELWRAMDGSLPVLVSEDAIHEILEPLARDFDDEEEATLAVLLIAQTAELLQRHVNRMEHPQPFKVTIPTPYRTREAALPAKARQGGGELGCTEPGCRLMVERFKAAIAVADKLLEERLARPACEFDVTAVLEEIKLMQQDTTRQFGLWQSLVRYQAIMEAFYNEPPKPPPSVGLGPFKLQLPQGLVDAVHPRFWARANLHATRALLRLTLDDSLASALAKLRPPDTPADPKARQEVRQALQEEMGPMRRALLRLAQGDMPKAGSQRVPVISPTVRKKEFEGGTSFGLAIGSDEVRAMRKMLDSGMAVEDWAEVVVASIKDALRADPAFGEQGTKMMKIDGGVAVLLEGHPKAAAAAEAFSMAMDAMMRDYNAPPQPERAGPQAPPSELSPESLDAACTWIELTVPQHTLQASARFWPCSKSSRTLADKAASPSTPANSLQFALSVLNCVDLLHSNRSVHGLFASSTQVEDLKTLRAVVLSPDNPTPPPQRKTARKGFQAEDSPKALAARLLTDIVSVEPKLRQALVRRGLNAPLLAEHVRVWNVQRRVQRRVWELRNEVLAAVRAGERRADELRRRAANAGEDAAATEAEALRVRWEAFERCAGQFLQVVELRAAMVEHLHARNCAFVIQQIAAQRRVGGALEDSFGELLWIYDRMDTTAQAVSRLHFFADDRAQPPLAPDEPLLPGTRPIDVDLGDSPEVAAALQNRPPRPEGAADEAELRREAVEHLENVAAFHAKLMAVDSLAAAATMRELTECAFDAMVVLSFDWTDWAGWRVHARLNRDKFLASAAEAAAAGRDVGDPAASYEAMAAAWASKQFWWDRNDKAILEAFLALRDEPEKKPRPAKPPKPEPRRRSSAKPAAPARTAAASAANGAAPAAAAAAGAFRSAADPTGVGQAVDSQSETNDEDAPRATPPQQPPIELEPRVAQAPSVNGAPPSQAQPASTAAPAAASSGGAPPPTTAPAADDSMGLLGLTLLAMMATTKVPAAAPVADAPAPNAAPEKQAPVIGASGAAPGGAAAAAQTAVQQPPADVGVAARVDPSPAPTLTVSVPTPRESSDSAAQKRRPANGTRSKSAGAAEGRRTPLQPDAASAAPPSEAAVPAAPGAKSQAPANERRVTTSPATTDAAASRDEQERVRLRRGGAATLRAATTPRGSKEPAEPSRVVSLAERMRAMETRRYDNAAGEVRKLLEEAVGMAAGVPERGTMGSRIEALCEKGYLSQAHKKRWVRVWSRTSEALHWDPEALWEEGSQRDWDALRSARKLILETCTWHELEDTTTWR